MERANSSRMARVIISPPGFASVCGSCCGWTRLAPTTHKSKLRGMRHTLKFLFMGALRPNLFQGLGESAPAPGISLFSALEFEKSRYLAKTPTGGPNQTRLRTRHEATGRPHRLRGF